ncbi:MAG TPA: replication restart DNA helicase PriA [Coleofasciculaceae cyanobacterium]
MTLKHDIHCPNCGSKAERQYFTTTHLTQTQCPACDYLMINCSRTGKVIEAYSPGLYARR